MINLMMLRPKQAIAKVSFFSIASQIHAFQAPPQTSQSILALARTSACLPAVGTRVACSLPTRRPRLDHGLATAGRLDEMLEEGSLGILAMAVLSSNVLPRATSEHPWPFFRCPRVACNSLTQKLVGALRSD